MLRCQRAHRYTTNGQSPSFVGGPVHTCGLASFFFGNNFVLGNKIAFSFEHRLFEIKKFDWDLKSGENARFEEFSKRAKSSDLSHFP